MEERFLDEAATYLEQYLRRIVDCASRLSDEQVWWRPNEASNSVGNLLLHLHGNLSQWVLEGLGGRGYARQRSAEFAARGGGRQELLERLASVVAEAREVVTALPHSQLRAPKRVQGYETDCLGVVFHVVEHMSYHAGQIVLIAKQLLGPEAGIEFHPQHRGE